MGAIGGAVHSRATNPPLNDASILAMRLLSDAARKKVSSVSSGEHADPILDRLAGLFGEFELDGATRLLLDDRRALAHSAARAHVVDLKANEVTTSEFAIDGQIEHRKVTLLLRDL